MPSRPPSGPANGEAAEPADTTASKVAAPDGAPGGPALEWLVLAYRVPSEPTRLRATVWRRLKSMGAVYLHSSSAVLPASPSGERALRKLRHEITEMQGTAVLFRAAVLGGEADVRAAFQAARNDEYEEIVDRCADFLAGLEKEYVAEHFTYAELEENEVDLVKLQNWFAKVSERDVFGASGRQSVLDALGKCEAALEDYASRVYQEESQGH